MSEVQSSRKQSSQASTEKPDLTAIAGLTASDKIAAVGGSFASIPPTCPHGRPVAKVMPLRDLEKLFKRIR